MGDIVDMHPAQETGLMAFARYQDLERAADRTAVKIKEGFMEMGYILKVARDTDILAGSGYSSHEEFADRRYGLDKGTVSRYIRIVERFSIGGSSHVLQDGYRDIGFAKLSLMLHMPDAIAEEITAAYSKQEVQAIKEEVDAEHAVSDIEVAIEAAEAPEEEAGSLLERAVRQLGREQPQMYRRLHGIHERRTIHSAEGASAEVMEALAPQGDAVHMVRIPGTGRLMVALSGDAASVTNVRSGDKERYRAEDILAAAMGIMHDGTAADSYLQEYGEPLEPEPIPEPEKERKGTSGRQKEKRKESKVVKAAPKKTLPERTAVEEAPPEPEEPLPGQIEIQDYPEAIPDAHYEEIPVEEPDPAADVTERPAEEPEAEKDQEGKLLQEAMAEPPEEGTREDIWMSAEVFLDSLKQYFAIWDRLPMPAEILQKAHMAASGLKEALERLMDMEEGQDGQEHHA